MTTQDLKALIEQVVCIAQQAGDKILEVYNDVDNFQVEQKDDNSPLTRADKEANDIICTGLIAISPRIPIISEENKEIDYSERKDYEYCWMVDPLDGTKEFIKRNGEFTVNIALIHNNRSIASVVYAPVMDEMYYAIKGEGAHMVKDKKETKISAATFTESDKNLGIVCSRSHLNEETQAFMNNYDAPNKVEKGSSLKFLILAAGGAHLYPRLAPTMEWDTAAAQVILEEAGGEVVRAEDGLPVEYNKANLLNPHFVARAKRV